MASLSQSARINNALAKYDITSFKDVIFHFPRSYLNLEYADEFKLNTNDKVVLYLQAETNPRTFKTGKMAITRFTALSEAKTQYKLVAFNQLYISSLVKKEEWFTVYGTINLHKREISVLKVFSRELKEDERLVPQYRLPSEMANHEFRRIVLKALKTEVINSLLPQSIIDKNGLIPLYKAFNNVHNPHDIDDVFAGMKALKYEEGLPYFLALLHAKTTNKLLTNNKKTIVNLKEANAFVKALPFTLTAEQLKAIREIGYDMNKQTLMYRLLQGDVGSGKTVVSFVALYINYLRGAQGVLLAPTETLAVQHYETLLEAFKAFPLRIRLLTGKLKEGAKKSLKRAIEAGEVDIVVGTHALFSEEVKYPQLELVVIDEQHKFGVNQRETLRNKGDKADLLLLSATPIPQTLANVIYADMDISTILSFPHTGRLVETAVINDDQEHITSLVEESLENKRAVYVIAPRIFANKNNSVKTLESKFKALFAGKVSVLHGSLSSEEKETALQNFKDGATPILISTTVVEVGINVMNAGLMLIYDANSFGFSSLHQLRGRIGRDGRKAHLYLISNDEDNTKLEAFSIENDGFKIAELDLTIRGPGELTGDRQSGMPNFLTLNVIKDLPLITKIKNDAHLILANKDKQEYQNLLKFLKIV